MLAPSHPIFQRIVDRCYRRAFRLAYPIVERWWRHHRHESVVMVVWLDDRVLGVQHSYRPGWTVPGGGVKRGEDHRLSAARELYEELGLTIAPADLEWVEIRIKSGHRGFCYLYAVRLTSEPVLRIDCREIVAAAFLSPETLIQAHDNFVTRYLRAQTQPVRLEAAALG
jgi:8-oxo-dGTP pyrophosphatase MutT (NUDIX family)